MEPLLPLFEPLLPELEPLFDPLFPGFELLFTPLFPVLEPVLELFPGFHVLLEPLVVVFPVFPEDEELADAVINKLYQMCYGVTLINEKRVSKSR